MTTRKVNLVGTSTLTVSLPSAWAHEHHIQKGDTLTVREQGNALIITSEREHPLSTRITIDAGALNKHILARVLLEAYINGVNMFELQFSKDSIRDERTGKEEPLTRTIARYANRFIGMEITKQTKNNILLESLVQKEHIKADVAARRIYFLIKQFMERITTMQTPDEGLEHYEDPEHDEIIRFLHYYLRVLNTGTHTANQRQHLFHIYLVIDKIVDKLRHIAQAMRTSPPSQKGRTFITDTFSLVTKQLDLLFIPYNIANLTALSQERYALRRRFHENWHARDHPVISEAGYLLDTLNDFSHCHLSIHLDSIVKHT